MCRSVFIAAVVALNFIGCNEPVDLRTGLQVLDVSSGWRDGGIVNGQTRLVPSITFRLKNASSQRLNILQVNAVFRRVNDEEEWGSLFMTVAGSEGLAPGVSSALLTISSPHGYTGIESDQAMLQNSKFVDAKVHLSAKYGSTQLVRVGEFGVTRRLIGK
jgi:hypothetical protein